MAFQQPTGALTAISGRGSTQGRPAPADTDSFNPFVEMSLQWRAAFLAYFVVYRLLTPGLLVILHPSGQPLESTRLALTWIYAILVFLPILLPRRRWGWLHPLVLPALLLLAKRLLTDPGHLVAPLAILAGWSAEPLVHPALAGWSPDAVAAAEVKGILIGILAVVSYYTGFFLLPRPRLPRLRIGTSRHLTAKVVGLSVLVVALFILFLSSRGGLETHLVSFSLGRDRVMGAAGQFVVIVQIGVVAPFLWYCLKRKATRNPLFWIVTGSSLLMIFLISGSRSQVFIFALFFLLALMIRNQAVPTVRFALLGMSVVLLLGLMGQVRRIGQTGDELSLSTLLDRDVAEMVTASQSEVDMRIGGYLPVIARGPQVGHLYGRTYLAAIFFWVPSAVWKGKPRGAGAHVSERILDRPEGSGGVPPGGVGEAYWNFDLPGVVTIYALFGIFHAWLAALLWQYRTAAPVWGLYIIAVLRADPHTISLVDFLQLIVPAIILLYWFGALRLPSYLVHRRKASLTSG